MVKEKIIKKKPDGIAAKKKKPRFRYKKLDEIKRVKVSTLRDSIFNDFVASRDLIKKHYRKDANENTTGQTVNINKNVVQKIKEYGFVDGEWKPCEFIKKNYPIFKYHRTIPKYASDCGEALAYLYLFKIRSKLIRLKDERFSSSNPADNKGLIKIDEIKSLFSTKKKKYKTIETFVMEGKNKKIIKLEICQ